MRYLVIGLCIFAAACAGESPTAPTTAGFEGTLEGLETVGTDPSQHHIDATANASYLGRLTVTADFTVSDLMASGTTTWTAANGDEFSTTFAAEAVVVPPTLTATETHTITGGTGQFQNASGAFTVIRTCSLSPPYNTSGTIIDGTIGRDH